VGLLTKTLRAFAVDVIAGTGPIEADAPCALGSDKKHETSAQTEH